MLTINYLTFANAPIGVVVYKATGPAVYANAAAATIGGCSVEQLLAEDFRNLEAWKRQGLLDAAEEALAGNTPVQREIHGLSSSGQEIWFGIWLLPCLSRQERHLLVLLQDISQRKRAELMLRESEDRYRSLFEGSPEGILVADPETRTFIYANPAICRMLGYAENELVRLGVSQIHPPEHLQSVIEEFDAQARGEKTVARDIPCLRKDGSVFHADISSTPVAIAGRPMLVGFFSDNTDRKEAEEHIEASENRYRRLHESMMDAFVCVDMAGRITEFNEVYRQMLGYERDELLSLTYRDLTPERWHEMEAAIVDTQVLRHGFSDIYEKEYRRKDGTVFPVELRTVLLTDGLGAPLGMWAMIRDITARKRVEELLRRNREDLARLSRDREKLLENERSRISRLLHDEIGQSLTFLLLQLARIEKRIQETDPSLANEVQETCEQARRMIDSVRETARSLRPISIENDGLIPSLRSCIQEFEQLSGIKCRLICRMGGSPVTEQMATTLYRIVQEALTNVARHARARTCEVRLTGAEGQIELDVCDDGIGATPDALGGHNSLGVVGMKERALAGGGELVVQNGPKGGVWVRARFPLAPPVSEGSQPV